MALYAFMPFLVHLEWIEGRRILLDWRGLSLPLIRGALRGLNIVFIKFHRYVGEGRGLIWIVAFDHMYLVYAPVLLCAFLVYSQFIYSRKNGKEKKNHAWPYGLAIVSKSLTSPLVVMCLFGI